MLKQHKVEMPGRFVIRFHAPDVVLEEWEHASEPETTRFYQLCEHVREMIVERLRTLEEEGVELGEVVLELEGWTNLGMVGPLT
jgi:hypothetical protein